MWAFGIIIILLIIRQIVKRKKGIVTYSYLIWYGIGRYIIESLRTDSLMINTLKQAQIISLIMIIIGIVLSIFSIKKEKYNKKNKYKKKN